jgi:hypothetical protein
VCVCVCVCEREIEREIERERKREQIQWGRIRHVQAGGLQGAGDVSALACAAVFALAHWRASGGACRHMQSPACSSACACVCVCVRACVRACVCVCVQSPTRVGPSSVNRRAALVILFCWERESYPSHGGAGNGNIIPAMEARARVARAQAWELGGR